MIRYRDLCYVSFSWVGLSFRISNERLVALARSSPRLSDRVESDHRYIRSAKKYILKSQTNATEGKKPICRNVLVKSTDLSVIATLACLVAPSSGGHLPAGRPIVQGAGRRAVSTLRRTLSVEPLRKFRYDFLVPVIQACSVQHPHDLHHHAKISAELQRDPLNPLRILIELTACEEVVTRGIWQSE